MLSQSSIKIVSYAYFSLDIRSAVCYAVIGISINLGTFIKEKSGDDGI